jgi:hypothetical protein
MIVPNAGMIETAVDQLQRDDLWKGHEWVLPDQRKELHEAVGDVATNDFAAGYELGLQTARILVAETFRQAF